MRVKLMLSRQPNIPATPPNSTVSSLPVDLSRRVLRNSSIASTICPNGGRWVFIQDQQNNLRTLQRSHQSSSWIFSPNTTIPSNAKPGTPLSVSCIELASGMPVGNWVSSESGALVRNQSSLVQSDTAFPSKVLTINRFRSCFLMNPTISARAS